MHTVSSELVEMVGEFEGFRSNLYNDPANHATIGFGHLVHLGPINGSEPAHFRNGISREEALNLLRGDLANAERLVNERVNVPLKPHQFDALVSFAFNVGRGNFSDSALLARLNNEEYNAVPGELLRWIFGGGQVLPGLVRRRHREGTLFARGIFQPVRVGEYINQEIINAFARAETKLGLELWTLLRRAGMTPEALAANRRAIYAGTPIAQIAALTQEERLAVLAELPAAVPLPDTGGPRELGAFLSQSAQLASVPLAPPAESVVRAPAEAGNLARRVARAWNRYGGLLTAIADELGLDPSLAVSVLACERGRLANPPMPRGLFAALGYESPEQLDDSFREERWRIVGLFDLIAGPNAESREVRALRVKDWLTFATLHYGTGRAEHQAELLAEAVEWFEVLMETRE